MATIRKRGDKYQVRVQLQGFDQVAKSFTTRRDAEAWGRITEAEMVRGTFIKRTDVERTPTLRDLVARYLTEVTPTKRGASKETYMQLFRDPAAGHWLPVDEAKKIMTRLRKFPQPGEETVFQSYHARTDPDSFHFLPSGSVGIPQVVSIYLALAYRYAKPRLEGAGERALLVDDGRQRVPRGSVLEALPDVAERQLTNCTWIVDYNRQSLDAVVREGLWSRFESMFRNFGWDVVNLKYGSLLEAAFKEPGGEKLRAWIDACPTSSIPRSLYATTRLCDPR